MRPKWFKALASAIVAGFALLTVGGTAAAAAGAPTADEVERIAPMETARAVTYKAPSWTGVSDETFTIVVRIALPFAIFIGGWLLAKLLSWLVFRGLLKTTWDDKLAEKLGIKLLLEDRKDDDEGVERFVSKVVYYLLMLLVIVAALQFAGLTQAASPIEGFVDTIMQALPFIGKAVLILVVAWVVGLILRKVLTKTLSGLKLDERFAEMTESTSTKKAKEEAEGDEAEKKARSFSETVGMVVFWVVMFIGLGGAFDALGIEVVAEPFQNAIDQAVGLLPTLAIAALILLGGYIIGRVARAVVENLLESAGFDKLIARIKLEKLFEKTSASAVAGLLVMFFILLQAVIAALHKLNLPSLSEPLTEMISRFWVVLPSIVLSAAIVAVGVVLGRLVRDWTTSFLKRVGFDDLLEKLGLGKLKDRTEHLDQPSEMIGLAVYVGIILVAATQALENLGMVRWSRYIDWFLGYAIQNLAVALAIVLIGLALANWVRDLIRTSGSESEEEDRTRRWAGDFARYAILIFAFTMAFHQLDIAQEFILISFGLLFGGLCLAAALAFGLGSREVAGDIVKKQYKKAQDANRKKPGLKRSPLKPPLKKD